MRHHLQGSGTVGNHNGTASAGGQSDGGQPAPGCDRYAPATTSSTARATCRPSLPELLETPNPASRPAPALRLRHPTARHRPVHTPDPV